MHSPYLRIRSAYCPDSNTIPSTLSSVRQGSRLPQWPRPTDADTALTIQSTVIGQLGERIGGWKCGLPAPGGIVLAPIHAGTMHTASPCAAWARGQQVRVEPELAFILGHDLPVRNALYMHEKVDAAVARTHLAQELIDSRYSAPSETEFVENLADGLLNQGLFIGPQVDSKQAGAAGGMTIRVRQASGDETELDGRHPNEDPCVPLHWLAEFLRSRGLERVMNPSRGCVRAEREAAQGAARRTG